MIVVTAINASHRGWGCSWVLESGGSSAIHQLEIAQSSSYSFQDFSSAAEICYLDQGRQYNQPLLYINKQDETRSLPSMELATKVWIRCLQNRIKIQAQNIQGLQNTIADFEPGRQFFRNQCMMKSQISKQIYQIWSHFTMKLFADRTTKLLPNYVFWIPGQDALSYSQIFFEISCCLESWSGFERNNCPCWLWWYPTDRVLPDSLWCSVRSWRRILDYYSHRQYKRLPIESTFPTTAELNALRVAITRTNLWKQKLNAQAVEHLLTKHLASHVTSKLICRKNQLHMLSWAARHRVCFKEGFTFVNVV